MVDQPCIDLNSDVGEGYGAWPGGPDAELMPLLTSVNVACGFHAGDPQIMRRTCTLAVQHGCSIGAQVSYPDLLGFGRRFMDLQPDELSAAVVYQMGALEGFARLAGSRVLYVKPHGALYNAIVVNEAQAGAVAAAVHEYDSTCAVMGLAGSEIQRACERAGLRFEAEGFADRRYSADGRLVPRTEPGALITEPMRAAEQAVHLAHQGVASICVHSDTPGAVAITSAVAGALADAGFRLRPFSS
ncbi:MAG: 5-oxoprolinase subunit PxpA [Ilumatobacteraceae bacterium]